MHILVITEGLPYPLISGRLRQFHFMQELARKHRVSLVATVPPGQDPERAATLAGIVHRVTEVRSDRQSRHWARKLWSFADNALRMAPSRNAAGLSRCVTELQAVDPVDVVLNARLPLPLRKLLPGVPIVTDICDATSASLSSQLPHTPVLARPVILAKRREARHAESAMATGSDHLLFASERDRQVLLNDVEELPPSSVLPNGVDLDYWRRESRTRPSDTVVFVGAMDYAPNADGARFLISEVLPLIRRSRPGVRLLIVGHSPSPGLLSAAAATPQVEVTGFVDDVRPYLEQAAVVLAPLRFGTGVPNKLLEAMAMEVPVVTTPTAAAGLAYPTPTTHPPLTVATDPRGLAEGCIGVLDRTRQDPSPDTGARTWVGERFRWDVLAGRVDAILRSAANL